MVVEEKGGGVLELVLGTEPGPQGEGGVEVRGEGGGREVEEEGGKCLEELGGWGVANAAKAGERFVMGELSREGVAVGDSEGARGVGGLGGRGGGSGS